jgi:hypothetical protein
MFCGGPKGIPHLSPRLQHGPSHRPGRLSWLPQTEAVGWAAWNFVTPL